MLSHQLTPQRWLIRAVTSTHHVRASTLRPLTTAATDADNTRQLYSCGSPASPLAPNVFCRTPSAIARQTHTDQMQPNRHTPLAPHGNCGAAHATCSELQNTYLQWWCRHENAPRVPANIFCTYTCAYTDAYIGRHT